MLQLTLETGLGLLRKKDYKAVHAVAIRDIKENIESPVPYFCLGVIASEHQNYSKALELFDRAIALDPHIATFHIHRAMVLSMMGQQNASKKSADEAAKYKITDPYLLDSLGVIYSRSGYHEIAISFFEKAVAEAPKIANFHYNLGASAQFIGDLVAAQRAYEEALCLDPHLYRAWPALVSLNKQTDKSNSLETLKSLFEAVKDNAEGQVQIGDAITKTLEDLDQHEESFDWLLRAKKAKREAFGYKREAGKKTFLAAKSTSQVEVSKTSADDGHTPIFIFGLPRTGTTLVDRILSSHTDVVSAGELNIFAELIKTAAQTPSNLVMDAPTFSAVRDLSLLTVRKKYLAITKERARGSKYMIDKMPLNFFYAGLIHRAFPDARIIALRRGAMDSCLSNFRQLFSTQYSYYNYTFDLEDIAFFYRQFDSLMSHWRETLPSDRFMEIHYEDIVFDQENQTRRLLEFCNLDFEDACLTFHENAAPVSTASSVQVRQPLYSGSIGRWKKYGDRLEGLRTALGPLADK